MSTPPCLQTKPHVSPSVAQARTNRPLGLMMFLQRDDSSTGSFSAPNMSKRAYFPAQTGFSDAQKSVEDFRPPDLCRRECSRSTPEGSILRFSDLKRSILRSISGDFEAFLRKCPENVPDPQIETAIRIESEKPSLWYRGKIPKHEV